MTRIERGPGERALAERERRLRTVILACGALGGAVGAVIGIDNATRGTLVLSPALAIGAVVAMTVGVLTAAILYFRAADELTLRDNLIAAHVAMYFYALAYPAWLLLARGQLVPPVDGEVLYVTTLIVLSLTYLWKRLRP